MSSKSSMLGSQNGLHKEVISSKFTGCWPLFGIQRKILSTIINAD
jgi:hypothetical protein